MATRIRIHGGKCMRKIMFLVIIAIVFSLVGVFAQSSTVCCERMQSGAFCQDVPADECASDSKQVPTACESTSFCKLGTCYDSNEGICMDNTPQLVCNDNGGIWSEESPPQCELGCCILGDQVAFVSLVRCKRLSASLGIETNYDTAINNELECIATVQAQDRGACVFEFEFERTCKFTTRAECDTVSEEEGEFFKDFLCSAEELGTICGPSSDTTCVAGKDEVYFVDTCGNPANIYDASKINDQAYWTRVISKTESCNVDVSNAESSSCGNCNYLLGSFCRDENVAGKSPSYGDFICADLNCVDDQRQERLHGESWCANDNVGSGEGDDSAGSRFYRRLCSNGEILVEPCEDFRQEVCIEDAIGDFSQAACRVNRWQDCTAQTKQEDCENTDRRDCFWTEGDGTRILQTQVIKESGESVTGACLPQHAPGNVHWTSNGNVQSSAQETQNICAQANAECIVEFEKGLFDDEKECKKNCHCLEQIWIDDRIAICNALGDCGPRVNWVGDEQFGKGFVSTRESV